MASSSSLRNLRSLFAESKLTATSPLKKPSTSPPKPDPTATSPPKPATSPPPPRDYESIANKFKRACRSSRFRHHRTTAYITTVRTLAAAKKYSLIADIINHQKEYKDITHEGFVVRLITLYGKSNMFEHARKLFDEMPDLGCERTVKSFNALLFACVNCKEYEKIIEIFDSVSGNLEMGIKPNVISYNTVVNAFCEMGSLDSAFKIVEEMEKSGVEPDAVTFNTILEAFYVSGRFDDAEKVWEMMREKGVVPNSRSFNPKLRALVASDRISEACELIEEMRKEGVEPDSFSYNSLIKGFSDSGNMEEAKKWFGEMVKNGCKPDRTTYVVLGYFACKIEDFGYAFELCKEALNAKFVIHRTMAQRVVDGLVKESKMSEAEELVELGNSNGFYRYDLKMSQTE